MKNNVRKSRFTLDMTPELRTRLKIAAARRGVTMRRYSLSAIERQLEREEIAVPAPAAFDSDAVDRARSLQQAVFGDRRLADDSTDLIRGARDERSEQL
ncbi:MAG: hypothetical protein ACNA7X_07110 [Dehalococcoidia bacterium]